MFFLREASYIIAEDQSTYLPPNIKPVHIWSRSNEEIIGLRKKFVRQWLFVSLELWTLIFLMSALYLGTGVNPDKYADNLGVEIVDFDGDLAGYYLFNAFRQTPPGSLTLNWVYKHGSDFNNDVDKPKDDLDNGVAWAVVILQPNTTRLINQSLSLYLNSTTLLVSPFASQSSVVVIYEEGRNPFTINNYLLPAIRAAIPIASTQYGQALRTQLINELMNTSNSTANRNLQVLNTFQLGSLLVDPLAAEYLDIHPGYPYVVITVRHFYKPKNDFVTIYNLFVSGQLATTLGYIYIYLISGLLVGSTIKYLATLIGKIHYIDLMIYRACNGAFQGLIISLIYSLIVLWFFGIHSGRLFMRYWMFNWLSALTLGLLFAVFTVNLGVLANSLLYLFIFLMLAGATLQIALQLSPPFYRYGYGLPLYHMLNGGRHLLFGSYSSFGLDVGVILIYFFIFYVLVIVTSAFRLRKEQKKMVEKSQQTKTDKMQYSVAAIAEH